MLILIEPPSEPLLTLAEVKSYLNIDDSDHDATLTGFIAAANGYIDGRDGFLGRALRPQRWQLCLPRFPRGRYRIELPLPPTIDVVEITYLDATGSRVSLESYRLIMGGFSGGKVVPMLNQCWPETWRGDFGHRELDTVQIEFTAGYQDLSSPTVDPLPGTIRIAALMMIGDWYENRVDTIVGTNVMEMPNSVKTILAPLRLYPVA